MDTPLLNIRDLTVSLPPWADRPRAVAGASLSIPEKEIMCVVGESGSGKSVMARAILGLLPAPHVRPTAGRILYRGESLLDATPARMREIRGAEIAMIFQEPMTALNPIMTIGRQVGEMIASHRDLTRQGRRALVLEMLDQVQLPDPERVYGAYPHELSGGQRQRAMIAMALVLEPKLLIADEPTTALDVTTQAQVLFLIKELQAKHQTSVLFITHDFGVVAQIADRVAVMKLGELVELGPAAQVLNAPQHSYTQGLIGAVPSLTPRPRRPEMPGAPIVLRTQALVKTYSGGRGALFGKPQRPVYALKAVDIAIKRGRTLGIVGESGSGKSTLARCIARLIEPNGGKVLLDGVDLTSLSRRQLRPHRKRLQMVFQDPFASLNPRQRVVDIIAQGPIVHGTPRRDALALARELLGLVGLNPSAADRLPHEFSGGQRQRIGIARALALRPDVLIADEPVSALDVSVQEQILALLNDVRERFELAVLFITHDLRVASQVCDDIAVMKNGEVVEQGPTADVFTAPSNSYTRELLAAVPGRDWLAGKPKQQTKTGTQI
jgi:peptide/nickel transport system ATP-binding protein